MKISIKKFELETEIKTSGIEFEVRDTKNKHLGDLILTKTKVVWCKGRTTQDNGIKLSWDKFIKLMNEQ